jgi:hypothetical protein
MQQDGPVVEMFTLFPHESAIVMRRGIELGICCTCLLVSHCGYLVLRHRGSEEYFDDILSAVCILRILCALPRPYYWWHVHRLFVEARDQPTPQLVRDHLLTNLGSKPIRVDRWFMVFYHFWLLFVTCLVWFAPFRQTTFAEQLWSHCQANYLWIITHRLLCVSMFYVLKNSNIHRGIPESVLQHYTTVEEFALPWTGVGSPECAICFGDYDEGDTVRKLQCGHHFHQSCIDRWLLQHQNHCPFCNAVVGPASSHAHDKTD